MIQDPTKYLNNIIRNCFKNFAFKIRPIHLPKVQFSYIKPIETARKMKQEILSISKKAREVMAETCINVYDPESLQSYLEKNQFKCPEKNSILGNYLQKVDKRTQKVGRESKCDIGKFKRKEFFEKYCPIPRDLGDVKKGQVKQKKEKNVKENPEDNCALSRVIQNFDKKLEDEAERDLWWVNKKKVQPKSMDLNSGLVKFLQNELQLMEKYVSLHAKDASFIKENVHITLHISLKEVSSLGNLSMMKSRRQQIRILCKQAILCLIDPSENAFVRYESDLAEIINQHFRMGCTRHFDLQSEEVTFYWSVLVVSNWAKVLLTHPNITLMQTISCALGCNSRRILVLSYPDPEEEENKE